MPFSTFSEWIIGQADTIVVDLAASVAKRPNEMLLQSAAPRRAASLRALAASPFTPLVIDEIEQRQR